jgi:FtsP/CotA-like multicopper oxidase with cupredoxin domain
MTPGNRTLVAVLAALLLLPGVAGADQQILQTPLSGKSIPKYVEPLPVFGPASGGAIPRVDGTAPYTVSMEEIDQQVLPAANAALGVAGYPLTTVWGYKVGASPALYPGVTVEAKKGIPTSATYVNNLVGPGGAPPKLQKYLDVDQTIHWADPLGLMCSMFPGTPGCMTPYGFPGWTGVPVANPAPTGAPVPAVVHLHGAEVQSGSDGGPEQWFTPNGLQGGGYYTASAVAPNAANYVYPNAQEATTLWFHDHALGVTRLNVYGGMAAFYLLRDNRDTGLDNNPIGLPAGAREIELVIQDRMFDTTGQLLFPGLGINPLDHPFWIPEFFGDTIVVNGKTWPYLNVEPKRYRLRFLDGSNARFYNLTLVNQAGAADPPVWQIGTDGGLLDAPVRIDGSPQNPSFLLAPGERADVIVDFTGFAPGTNFLLKNSAKAPFPKGTAPDPRTVGQIMQFRVVAATGAADNTCNPALAAGAAGACALRPAPMVRLVNPATGTLAPGLAAAKKRQLTLVEVMGMAGPLEVLVNNTKWAGKKATTGLPVAGSFDGSYAPAMGLSPNSITEGPQVGSTEVWEIINLTADAHPIHLHLVQFQLLNRQPFQAGKYTAAYNALFPGGIFAPGDGPPLLYTAVNADNAIGGNPAVSRYLQGSPVPPALNEAGWKDTVVMHPGEVTRIAVRWAPTEVPATGAGSATAGTNLYPFDPTSGPGYVWHCHIIDHEDNEMMRPYQVTP